MSTAWSPEVRERALKRVGEIGLAAAAREAGVGKTTLHKWAREENVPTVKSEEERLKTAQAVVASRLERSQRMEASRERLQELLTQVAELGAKKELTYIKAGKATLSEIVGARTRAIHDLRLLAGDSTEKIETTVSVEAVAALRDNLRQRLHVVA